MKNFSYSIASAIAGFSPFPIAHAVTISMDIPGAAQNSSSTPGAFVANFYQFALMIGGILAFGVIVYGGVKYMASAGNPSGQSDAKEWIEAALLGLLLLVGAYFILSVVNPQLLNLNLPALTPVDTQSSGTVTGSGACTSSCCPGPGVVCTGNSNSATVPAGTETQGSDGCPSTNACGANGGVCAGDCASPSQICVATGPGVTANNTSPSGSTLPWHCTANTTPTQ